MHVPFVVVFWMGGSEKVTLGIGNQLNLETEDDNATDLQNSYVAFLTSDGFIKLESDNQRI